MSDGEWRTVRQPKAPPAVRAALADLLLRAAELARAGNGEEAIAMRKSIDVLGDFVTYEPRTDD